MVRTILARQSRPERRQARQNLTLESQRIRPSTRVRYLNALRMFFQSHFVHTPLPRTPFELDHQVADFIEVLYQEGESISVAGDLLSGLSFFMPHLHGHLRYGWQLFRTWRRTELPAQAPPFDDLLIASLAGLALQVGLLPFASALLLAYHCMLRTGEIFTLTCDNIALAHDLTTGAIVIPMTKKNLRDCTHY